MLPESYSEVRSRRIVENGFSTLDTFNVLQNCVGFRTPLKMNVIFDEMTHWYCNTCHVWNMRCVRKLIMWLVVGCWYFCNCLNFGWIRFHSLMGSDTAEISNLTNTKLKFVKIQHTISLAWPDCFFSVMALID